MENKGEVGFLKRNKGFRLFGPASIGGGAFFLLEKEIPKNLLYTTAVNKKQAFHQFKEKFEKKYGRSFYLGKATIEEVEMIEEEVVKKVEESKEGEKQLRLFE